MKSIELLLDDHKHLLAASDVLAQMAACAEGGQVVSQTDLRDLLRFLEEFGDRHHQGIEEGVLFPALLLDPAQQHYQRLCGLIFEHERQRSLVVGLHDSLFTSNTKDFIYYARRYNDVLRAHIKEEEETFFPLVASTLSDLDDKRVEQDMKTYDAVWQEKELSPQLQRLSEMALKYPISKTARSA